MATLEEFLATCFTGRADVPNVAALCQQYAKKMEDAGFGDTQTLLTMDDDDLKEVSSELKSAGILPGHVMAIRTNIKSKRQCAPDGRSGRGNVSGRGGSDGGRGGGSGAIGACMGAAADDATPLAARPPATVAASASPEEVISHVRDRFAQLTEILLTMPHLSGR